MSTWSMVAMAADARSGWSRQNRTSSWYGSASVMVTARRMSQRNGNEPTLLADAILSALEDQPGERLAPPRGPATEPEDRLRSFLADRELLLVLDNCEYVAEAVGRLAAMILAGSPGCGSWPPANGR